MSSFNLISNNGSINRAQRQNLDTANSVKKNVLEKATRFQSLDGQAGVDLAIEQKDEVVVLRENATPLPQSTGNKLAHLAVGMLAPKESQEPIAGFSRADGGKVVTADLTTFADGKETDFQYKKQDDGTEIFHGPTKDGFAVVVENKKTGLLMMQTSDAPLRGSFNAAERGDIQVANPPEPQSPQTGPTTFADRLKALASAEPAAEPVATEGVQAKEAPPESGFLAPFGGSVKETIDSAKESGEKLLGKVTDGVKETGHKMDEMAKDTAKSVKDWTQSDTAETVGKLLFGKLNPFGKRK